MKIRQKKAENRFPAVLTGATARLSSKNRLFFLLPEWREFNYTALTPPRRRDCALAGAEP